MAFNNHRAPLSHSLMPCHHWIETTVTVPKTFYLEIGRMVLKNNKAPLLCPSKLFWKQSVKWRELLSGNASTGAAFILSVGNLKFDILPRSFCIVCEMKLELLSGNASTWAAFILSAVNLKFDILPRLFCMDIAFVNGNYFWVLHDDTMRGTMSKRRDGWTDGQTDE